MIRRFSTPAASLVAALLFALASHVHARTEVPLLQQWAPPAPRTDEDLLQRREIPSRGPMNAAGRDTVYFGYYQMINGEAYAVPGETWTFDHGAPDPMEGWRAETRLPSEPFFRHITAASWAGHGNAVLAPIIAGTGSAWLGVMEDWADSHCWARGLGYGNNWFQQLTSPSYSLTAMPALLMIDWRYYLKSESNFDFLRARLLFEDNTTLELGEFTGTIGNPAADSTANGNVVLPNWEFSGHTSCQLVFEFTSDGSWSDEDGKYDSAYGACTLDNVSITPYPVGQSEFWGFDSGLSGWTASSRQETPTYSGITPVSTAQIPPNAACGCNIAGNVLEMYNTLQDPHPESHWEAALGPIVDRAAFAPGTTSVQLRWDMYGLMPQAAGVFYRAVYQEYPYLCADGQPHWSPIRGVNGGQWYHIGSEPSCFTSTTNPLPATAEKYRFGFELYSGCSEFGIPDCHPEQRNVSPVFDNVRVFCTDAQVGPPLQMALGGLFTDAFPADGTASATSTAHADAVWDVHRDDPTPDLLGDSLVISGPLPSSSTKWEARMWWRIPREGPGQSSASAYAQWKTTVSDGRNIVGMHAPFTFGEMDSVQAGTLVAKNRFISEFKETDDDFVGEGLDHNEMIWDDVLTPGTQVQYFITSNYTCSPAQVYFLPDTIGGNFYDFDILPTYRSVAGANVYPGILLISVDPNEKYTIERALNRTLTGVDLPLPNPAPWDVYDFRDANSSWNGRLARSNGGNSGITLPQLQAYRGVILAQGVYGAGTLVDEDVQLLAQWPLNPPCGSTMPPQGMILEGDNAAAAVGSVPSGPGFQSQFFNVLPWCEPIAQCEQEPASCMNLLSSGFGPTLPGAVSVFGNACPYYYSFDELGYLNGASVCSYYDAPNAGTIGAQVFAERPNTPSPSWRFRGVENSMSYDHLYDGSGCPSVLSAYAIATGATRSLSASLNWIFDSNIPALISPPCSAPPSSASISGRIFQDVNGDCIWSAGEPSLAGWVVVLQPNAAVTVTGVDGTYQFGGLAAGTYTVRMVPAPDWVSECNDLTRTATVGAGEGVTGVNFAEQPVPGVVDVRIVGAAGIAKPGFATSYTLDYSTPGTAPVPSSTVTLVLPTGVTYVASPGGNYNSANRTVTWTLGQLAVGAHGTLQVTGLLDTNLTAGSQLVSQAHITPFPDAHPSNNDVTITQTVVNSFDPNDKLVSPTGAIPASQVLSYEVRFQNLGTASATNISITDVLDTDLDLATLELGPTRHPAVTTLSGRTITWTFTGIELPPASQDEAGSHGYVTFQARPLAGLPAGTQITNQASIVFDFNPPVLTNVVTNTLLSTTAIDEPVLPKEFALDRIAPNPAQGGATSIRLALPRPGDAQVIVYDVAGRRVRTVLDGPVTAGWLDVPWDGRRDDGARTSAGIYFVRAQLAAGKSRVEKTARLVWLK